VREAEWAHALTPAEQRILILLMHKIRAYPMPVADSVEQPVLARDQDPGTAPAST
jgi:hypothetical protein